MDSTQGLSSELHELHGTGAIDWMDCGLYIVTLYGYCPQIARGIARRGRMCLWMLEYYISIREVSV
jgi:hypothetical protein